MQITAGCQFASDNTAGICPPAMQAMCEANEGWADPYGEDHWTQRASDLLFEVVRRISRRGGGPAAKQGLGVLRFHRCGRFPTDVFLVDNGSRCRPARLGRCRARRAVLS